MKRGAESQLLKDAPSSPIITTMNFGGTAQQATPAQLAGRKIAGRKRFSKSPSVGLQGAPSMPNPFNSSQQQQQQAPQQSGFLAPSSALGANSGAGGFGGFGAQQLQQQQQQQQPQPAQSSFQFGGATSSGFNFGGGNSNPNANSSAPSNPFSFGTQAQNAQPSAPTPFAFNSGLPQQQQQQSAACPAFGANQNSSHQPSQFQPKSTAFSFGAGSGATFVNPFAGLNQATQNSSSGLGAQQQQSQQQPPKTTPFSFGGPSALSSASQPAASTAFNPFGATASNATQISSAFGNSAFGSSSAPSTSAAAPQTTSGFSFSSTPAAAAATNAGTSTPSLFSAPKSTEATQDKPKPFAGFSVGNNASTSGGSTPNMFGSPSLFAKSSAPADPGSSAPAPASTSLFSGAFSKPSVPNAPAGSTSNATSSPFSFGASKLGGLSTSGATFGNNGGNKGSSPSPAVASNPFSFGAKKPTEAEGASAPPAAAFSVPTGSGFSNTSQQPNGAGLEKKSLFSTSGAAGDIPSESKAEDKMPKSLGSNVFGGTSMFSTKPSEAPKPASSPLFPSPAAKLTEPSKSSPFLPAAVGSFNPGAVAESRSNLPIGDSPALAAKPTPPTSTAPASTFTGFSADSSNTKGPQASASPFQALGAGGAGTGISLGKFAPKAAPSSETTAHQSSTDKVVTSASTMAAVSTMPPPSRPQLGPMPKINFEQLNTSLLNHLQTLDKGTDWSPVALHYLRTVLESGLGNLSERIFPPKIAFSVAMRPNPAAADPEPAAETAKPPTVGQKRTNQDAEQPPAKRPSSLFPTTTTATFSAPFAAKAQTAAAPERVSERTESSDSAQSKPKSQTANLFSSIMSGPSKEAPVATQVAVAPAANPSSKAEPSPFSATWANGKPPSTSMFPTILAASGNSSEPKSATHPAFSSSALATKLAEKSGSSTQEEPKKSDPEPEAAKKPFSFAASTSASTTPEASKSTAQPANSLFTLGASSAAKTTASPFATFSPFGTSSTPSGEKDGNSSTSKPSIFSSTPMKVPSFPTGIHPKLGGNKSLFFNVAKDAESGAGSDEGSSTKSPFSFAKPAATSTASSSAAATTQASSQDEDAQNDPQVDLASMDAEKETHDALFETGYARLQFRNSETKTQEVQGTGRLALLRKKGADNQAKTRVLLKATPSGRSLVNGWMLGAFHRVGKKSAQGMVMISSEEGGMKSKLMIFNFQSAEVADKFVEVTKSCAGSS